jgi:glycine cleavage system H protein
VRREGDGTLSIGITDHAQEQLGDIVYVEPPKGGRRVAKGEAVGVVESVKAASDIYAPVAGEVVGSNDALSGTPEKVNEDAFAAWIYRIKPDNPADVDQLLDAAGYEKAASN